MIDRGNLLASIKNAQKEIDYLHSKVNKTNSENTERLLELYNILESRTQKLMESQQQINNLHLSINNSKHKINEIANEREQAVNERNYLRSEYDHLQKVIKERELEQEELRQKIRSLREHNKNGLEVAIEEQIRTHEETIEKLQLEKNNYKQQSNQFQINLKEKMIQVVKLSEQLQQAEMELRKKQEQVSVLEQKNHKYKLEVNNHKTETKRLKSLINETRMQTDADKQRILELEKIKNKLNKKLEDANEMYTRDLIKAEEEIESLKDDLLMEQNNLAMEKEKNGAPAQLTVEALRILEQEYQPRFMTLYKECMIQKEFYSDFFSLIPSDRLKVEACIVNLNFNYDQNMTKVRPHTVKTNKGTTIDEYPFGQEGRIYFKKEKGKVNLYRISRTKNGKMK